MEYTTKKILSEDIEIHIIEIPKLTEQWHEEKVNPWKDPFVRWLYCFQQMRMST